ncbi:MAG: glycoside hydrolase family 172 protein [Acidobacteriota bacterium]
MTFSKLRYWLLALAAPAAAWAQPSFAGLPQLRNAETRSISAENPTGERGGGARAVPTPMSGGSALGTGWKISPDIVLIRRKTVTLADVQGPGVIQHIWITVSEKAYRDCILRFYWDDEKEPSIESPLGDFFANAHAMRYPVNSLMIAANPSGGFNSYWPMPFRKHARITIENQRPEDIAGFFYQITYSLEPVAEDAAYFHASWRRSMSSREHPEHTIVDGIVGQGHYVGTFIGWEQLSNGWWGEGEVKFYLDGDDKFPTICTTGTEDYFGGAWNFGDTTFSAAYAGYPLFLKQPGQIPKHAMYRWHVPDPIRFKKELRVTIQTLGHWPNGKFQPLTDDLSSVAYWYQAEPHKPFPAVPAREARFPR